MNQNRLRSKAVWVAIVAQAVVILQATNIMPQTDIDTLNTVITATLEMLVLFGVLNNPTVSDKF